MKKKKKIRRRCKCGCGGITNPGKIWICGHNKPMLNKKHTEATKKKMRKPQSEEHKRKISFALKGNTNGSGKRSKEQKLNMSLGKMKCNPNDEYCDIWRDQEYKKDIRKDYCENTDCKKVSRRLQNHHIHLDKKRCAPCDIITLCVSCHAILHRMLEPNSYIKTNPKNFIIINRPDHMSYIHKKTHKIIRINKIIN